MVCTPFFSGRGSSLRFIDVRFSVYPPPRGDPLQESKRAPVGEENDAEKAAKMHATGLQKELAQANIRVDGLTVELTKAEKRAREAEDAKNRQVISCGTSFGLAVRDDCLPFHHASSRRGSVWALFPG